MGQVGWGGGDWELPQKYSFRLVYIYPAPQPGGTLQVLAIMLVIFKVSIVRGGFATDFFIIYLLNQSKQIPSVFPPAISFTFNYPPSSLIEMILN